MARVGPQRHRKKIIAVMPLNCAFGGSEIPDPVECGELPLAKELERSEK